MTPTPYDVLNTVHAALVDPDADTQALLAYLWVAGSAALTRADGIDRTQLTPRPDICVAVHNTITHHS